MEQVTLDAAREQFYVAQRACERMAVQLGALVASLEQQKPEDGWLSTVQQEAARLATFHAQQHAHWAAMAGDIDAYVDSVRSLADQIAINGAAVGVAVVAGSSVQQCACCGRSAAESALCCFVAALLCKTSRACQQKRCGAAGAASSSGCCQQPCTHARLPCPLHACAARCMLATACCQWLTLAMARRQQCHFCAG